MTMGFACCIALLTILLFFSSHGLGRRSMRSAVFFLLAIGVGVAVSQSSEHTSEQAASPEMARLSKALAGDFVSTETMERSAEFPQGGSRQGEVHARLAAGGNVLLYEVHSNGSAGELDGFLTIWWEPKEKQYEFFACFNSSRRPCETRGSAHWDGET